MTPISTGYSKHARQRMQKRSIPPLIVDWIVAYGRARRSHGADVLFLDRKGRKHLREDVGHAVYARVGRLLNAIVVLADDGTIITAAHRLSRQRN